MKRLMSWMESSATLFFSEPGRRDDIRLDTLFDALAQARTATAARPIEERIWTIWSDAGDPEINALMRRGEIALRQDALDQARDAYDAVIARMPDFAEGWNKRATVNYLLGDFEASISDVERTLALEPRHFGALSGLGLIAVALGQDEQALEAFEAALDIHPNLPGVDTHIADLRERLGRPPR